MIICKKGENFTSTGTEDEVLFVEPDEMGKMKPAGRGWFDFSVVSGTVQVAVGTAVNTTLATSHTTSAAQNFSLSILQEGTPTEAAQEGRPYNLRTVGVGVVAVTW